MKKISASLSPKVHYDLKVRAAILDMTQNQTIEVSLRFTEKLLADKSGNPDVIGAYSEAVQEVESIYGEPMGELVSEDTASYLSKARKGM